MNLRHRATATILALLAATGPLRAEEVPPSAAVQPEIPARTVAPERGDGLTLLQLVQVALTRNPQTRLALAEAREAMADVGIAKSFYYPEVSLTGTLLISDERQPEYPGIDDITKFYEAGPEIDLYYLLLDFGGRDAYVAMMRELLTAAKFNQNQVMQDVILSVQAAYFQALASETLVLLARTELQSAAINLAAQEQALEAGLGIPTEVLEAASALEGARSDLQAAESAQADAYGNVNVACGAPANAPLKLAPMPTLPDVAGFEQNVDGLIASGLVNRPDLAEQLAVVRAKEDAVRQAESTYWPEVSLEAEWYNRWFRARNNPQFVGPSITESGRGTFVGAAIVIDWELFDGFRRVNEVRAARAEVQQAAAEFDQVKLDVGQQVWQAYFAYLSAGRALTFRRAGLVAAESQFELVREGLVSGLADLIDFYQAEVALAQAEADLAQAQADWYIATASVIYATGRLTPMTVPR
ncbi:MAG: TolC family protein [Verrucomicrobiota bacterium]